jgi:glutaredoxin
MHKPLLAPLLASLLMTLAGASAQAQGVYRIVGPDGKVTFSDRPPADAPAQAARTTGAAPAPASGNAALPYELRQIATRFPVTIYTGNDCAPCTSLRNALVARGVPFTERTVTTSEDTAALQRLSGSASLPFGSIGGQQLVGFSDAEWTQYLDAAGYPKQSQLPSSYRPTAATPLVAVKPVETAPAADKPKAAAPVRPAPAARPAEGPTPSNPAGIRF